MSVTDRSWKTDPEFDFTSSGRIPEGIYPFQHEGNVTDGSEFLDDAIRTKDQPLGVANVEDIG